MDGLNYVRRAPNGLTPADEWSPTVAPAKEEGAAAPLKKRESEGHEQEAKEPRGDGRWASMGELLM